VKSRLSVLVFSVMFIHTFFWEQAGCAVPTVHAAADQRGPTVRPQAPTGEVVKGEQWLLTIGINTYLSWPRLKTATNDARALKNVLLERYHVDPIHVIELYDENATRKNILGTLRDLSGKINPDDSLLIFYAGHGHIDNITKKGSWIPVESGTDDPSAWISNQDIKDYLHIDAIRAKHVLLISDSCFSGDFFRGTRGGLPEVTDTVIKKAYQLSSRQAITSGGLEPVSDDGFGGNSVFSHFLVAALQNNTKPYLIPSELFPAIKSGVAQNAEQFPQLGSLYGVGGQDGGELVLFLKQENRLENLSAVSAERQKELEQLRKVDAEAFEIKQKEQAEIAKKQAEMDELDSQISEMRGRLGSGAARATDGLDQIIAMAEQKEEQGKRLDELRRQREAEERKRQEEIERLKREAKAKLAAQVQVDLAKYEKVASSKYAQDMKGAAWGALIANYPDAKNVPEGDVDLFVAQLGLARDGNEIISNNEKGQREAKKQKDTDKLKQQKIADNIDDIELIANYHDQSESLWSQGIQGTGFHIIRKIPIFNQIFGKGPVVCSHPVDSKSPAIFLIHSRGNAFNLFIHGHPMGDSRIEIWAGDKQLLAEKINQNSWRKIAVPDHTGTEKAKFLHFATGWSFEFLYLYLGNNQ